MSLSKNFQLIVTIVAREKTDKVLEAIEKEGVRKSTILMSRGVSDNNPTLFFDVKIEPQREVIYTLVPQVKADQILDKIVETGELEKPLNGLAFILDVKKVGGLDLSMFEDINL